MSKIWTESLSGAGYAHWAKIKNIKEAAKTLNFLTENNLLQYTDLNAKVAEINATYDSAANALKTAESRLFGLSVLIKHLTVPSTPP